MSRVLELLQNNRDILENISRSRSQFAFLGEGVGLARILGEYRMYVDTEDLSLAPHLIMDGFWESWITLTLLNLRPGMRCADIGANHGYYSLLLADICGSDVYSFEPQPKLAKLLKQTATVNGFGDRVHVRQKAVGAETSSFVLRAPLGHEQCLGSVYCSQEDQLSQTAMMTQETYKGTTQVVRLDDEVPGKLDFIKIDAEGFEPLVWEGMQRHLAAKPIILMEFTPAAYKDPAGFLDQIEACYTLRNVDTSSNIVPITRDEILGKPGFEMLWLEAD